MALVSRFTMRCIREEEDKQLSFSQAPRFMGWCHTAVLLFSCCPDRYMHNICTLPGPGRERVRQAQIPVLELLLLDTLSATMRWTRWRMMLLLFDLELHPV